MTSIDPAAFYDGMAENYEAEFDAPHRRAYDDLCWEYVDALIGDRADLLIVDVGCGVGRWARPLVERGHRVLGIEPSADMCAGARALNLGDRFELQHATADDAVVATATADLVVAMGSIQYSPDPTASIATMASWLKPGGHMGVLVDSLMGLVTELIRNDDPDQALERVTGRRARFTSTPGTVEHHLFDAAELRAAFEAAGLADVSVRGLLVDWTSRPREQAMQRMIDNPANGLDLERRLSELERLADMGKQLLAIGQRPA